jgi:prolipoprotein diacylglyceryltransferase
VRSVYAHMKEALPILGAGAAFSGGVLLGLIAGVFVARRTQEPLWTLGGLLVGLAIGAYGAIRLVRRSL